jgi:hypothetical protein
MALLSAPARAQGSEVAHREGPSSEANMAKKHEPRASRVPTPEVDPIAIDGVRYEIVRSSMGRFRAVDDKSGRELWAINLYRTAYDKKMQKDAQDVLVSSMKKEPGGTLRVEDDAGRVYRVDLTKRTSRIEVWPVFLREVSREPLKVEVVITNTLDRTVSFDKPSIAFDGRLENELFEIRADGKSVPYGGMMKKRAAPDSFLKLKPGERYLTTVDLSSSYAVPKDAKSVEIRFAHHNHSSTDDFDLASEPLALSAP